MKIEYLKRHGQTTLMILVLEAYIPHITGKPDKRASSDQGKVEDFVDENGIRTTVEYAMTEEGKKVKV